MTLHTAPPASDIDVEKDSVRLEPIHGLYGPADPEAAVKTCVPTPAPALPAWMWFNKCVLIWRHATARSTLHMAPRAPTQSRIINQESRGER